MIFLGLASMPRSDMMYPSSFPFGTPKIYFSGFNFDAEPLEVCECGGQVASEPLHALDVAYRAHVGDGHDFFGVGFDAALGHDVSEQLLLRNPENTFFWDSM